MPLVWPIGELPGSQLAPFCCENIYRTIYIDYQNNKKKQFWSKYKNLLSIPGKNFPLIPYTVNYNICKKTQKFYFNWYYLTSSFYRLKSDRATLFPKAYEFRNHVVKSWNIKIPVNRSSYTFLGLLFIVLPLSRYLSFFSTCTNVSSDLRSIQSSLINDTFNFSLFHFVMPSFTFFWFTTWGLRLSQQKDDPVVGWQTFFLS